MDAATKQSPDDSGTNIRPSLYNKDYLDHLKKINDIYYDQIKIADQKAAYIFTFMLAFLITSADGRAAFQWQRYAYMDFSMMAISAGMALAASTALIAAIWVVLPRHRAKATSLFWGGWTGSRELLLDASRGNDLAFIFQEYLANVDNLALIAKDKYRCVKIAFRALTVMVVAYLLLLVLVVKGG